MANPSGATFSVDAYPLGGYPLPPTDPDASINVDVFLATAPAPQGRVAIDPIKPDASINVDANGVTLPTPGKLKVWDGARWVPVRGYTFDSVAQAWVPTT